MEEQNVGGSKMTNIAAHEVLLSLLLDIDGNVRKWQAQGDTPAAAAKKSADLQRLLGLSQKESGFNPQIVAFAMSTPGGPGLIVTRNYVIGDDGSIQKSAKACFLAKLENFKFVGKNSQSLLDNLADQRSACDADLASRAYSCGSVREQLVAAAARGERPLIVADWAGKDSKFVVSAGRNTGSVFLVQGSGSTALKIDRLFNVQVDDEAWR